MNLENIIYVTSNTLRKVGIDPYDFLCKSSGMKLIKHYQGNWKEVPGVFFQDVSIFQTS